MFNGVLTKPIASIDNIAFILGKKFMITWAVVWFMLSLDFTAWMNLNPTHANTRIITSETYVSSKTYVTTLLLDEKKSVTIYMHKTALVDCIFVITELYKTLRQEYVSKDSKS